MLYLLCNLRGWQHRKGSIVAFKKVHQMPLAQILLGQLPGVPDGQSRIVNERRLRSWKIRNGKTDTKIRKMSTIVSLLLRNALATTKYSNTSATDRDLPTNQSQPLCGTIKEYTKRSKVLGMSFASIHKEQRLVTILHTQASHRTASYSPPCAQITSPNLDVKHGERASTSASNPSSSIVAIPVLHSAVEINESWSTRDGTKHQTR